MAIAIVSLLVYVFVLHLQMKRLNAGYTLCFDSYESLFWENNTDYNYVPHRSWEDRPRNPIEEKEKDILKNIYKDLIKTKEYDLLLSMWNRDMEMYCVNKKREVNALPMKYGSDSEKNPSDGVIYDISQVRDSINLRDRNVVNIKS